MAELISPASVSIVRRWKSRRPSPGRATRILLIAEIGSKPEASLMKVYVVDDDLLIRTSLTLQLEAAGYAVASFASATEFLSIAPSLVPGCVLLDVRMPGADGLSVQSRLAQLKLQLPIIMMTGHGEVGMAVRAMKAGALDFVEKPFSRDVILASVRLAQQHLGRRDAHPGPSMAIEKLARLSRRERQVLDGLIAGLPNKTIAYDLGLSPRTVELHRKHVMEKTEARSLAALVRLALSAAAATATSDHA